MSDELVLYHSPFSRGRVAHWMLEEVGQPYRLELLDFARRDHKKPEYLALNPMGKIPTLVHRGVVVTEVAAIVAYLADAFPEAGLAPALIDPARGTYLRWLFFAAGCVEPAITDHALQRPPVAETQRIGYGTYADTLDALEHAVSQGPYILGERFSAADVYVGSQIGWGLFQKTIDPRPAFTSYFARLHGRPANQRMVAQNGALAERLKGEA